MSGDTTQVEYHLVVEVEDDDGHTRLAAGRITGQLVAETPSGEQWYLTDDHRLLRYTESDRRISGNLLDDPDFPSGIDDNDILLNLCAALGNTVDL